MIKNNFSLIQEINLKYGEITYTLQKYKNMSFNLALKMMIFKM